jgi:hypothetical protein
VLPGRRDLLAQPADQLVGVQLQLGGAGEGIGRRAHDDALCFLAHVVLAQGSAAQVARQVLEQPGVVRQDRRSDVHREPGVLPAQQLEVGLLGQPPFAEQRSQHQPAEQLGQRVLVPMPYAVEGAVG